MNAAVANQIKKESPRKDEENLIPRIDEILAGYAGKKEELIPILQQAQQAFGYLPAPAIKRIADFVGVPEATAFGVATFYAQFKLVPSGRNIVRVCRGTACHVKGGSRILVEVQKKLGIKSGENTPDMEYALETVACIGACALAPNMVVNNKIYGNMKTGKIATILDSYKER